MRIATCLAAPVAKGLYVIAIQGNALLGARKGGEETNAIKNAILDVMVKNVPNCAVIALETISAIMCLECVLKDANQGTEEILAKKRVGKVFLVFTVAKSVGIA